jgi:diazepam-binding inhibitor (GABA receptor modulating acyl-CoA-binding protein)
MNMTDINYEHIVTYFPSCSKTVEDYIRNGNELTNDDMLTFYSYFKQATIGNCNTQIPSFFQIKEKAKWNAWNNIKGMSSQTAKIMYVNHAIMLGLFHVV